MRGEGRSGGEGERRGGEGRRGGGGGWPNKTLHARKGPPPPICFSFSR